MEAVVQSSADFKQLSVLYYNSSTCYSAFRRFDHICSSQCGPVLAVPGSCLFLGGDLPYPLPVFQKH